MATTVAVLAFSSSSSSQYVEDPLMGITEMLSTTERQYTCTAGKTTSRKTKGNVSRWRDQYLRCYDGLSYDSIIGE